MNKLFCCYCFNLDTDQERLVSMYHNECDAKMFCRLMNNKSTELYSYVAQ